MSGETSNAETSDTGALRGVFSSLIAFEMKLHQLIVPFLLLAALELPQLLGETTAVTSYLANSLFEHNLHEVVPHRYWRSGRIPPVELGQFIKEHGIKTVVNLSRSGDGPGNEEQQAVQAAGARYFEVPLNAGRQPSLPRIRPLLDLFERIETPVLVHCTSGTHRSGVAAALWLLEREGATFQTAARQLSPRYGYFRAERRLKAYVSGYRTIDEMIWDYGQAHSLTARSFREWAEDTLEPYDTEDSLQSECPLPSGKL
ncbi:MAG: dual specificity protein phosphatase family protein [Bdellovibrionales bacterium]|nr:dual specificity protein phosphatase family protein [Bdellovibrionales bacterium]